MTVDLSGLIGVPFVNGGRDAKRGLDCWGLAMEVFQRYGQALPDFTVDAFAFDKIAQLAGGELATRRWEELQRPLDKDAPLVVLMRMHPSLVTHAGVYIGQGRVIHTMESTDAIMSQINRLGSRIVGYYRPC